MSGSAGTSSASSVSAGSPMLLRPVETVTAAVRQLPGAAAVEGVLGGVVDAVGGMVTPRARRVAAYAGVGLLGAVGVVEWPLAAAGAAVVWLMESRRTGPAGGGGRPDAAKPPAGRARADRPNPMTQLKSTATAQPKATTRPKATMRPKSTTQPTSTTRPKSTAKAKPPVGAGRRS